jgi:hypothetical protein
MASRTPGRPDGSSSAPRLHTGSINDHAAYLVAGMVLMAAVLLLG